jgi:hypothetical protein
VGFGSVGILDVFGALSGGFVSGGGGKVGDFLDHVFGVGVEVDAARIFDGDVKGAEDEFGAAQIRRVEGPSVALSSRARRSSPSRGTLCCSVIPSEAFFAESRDLVSLGCHPEQSAFCPTKDLSEPRDRVASFATQ